MTTMDELRWIMTGSATAGDLDERIRKIYRAGVSDGAHGAVESSITVGDGDGDQWAEVEGLILQIVEELR